MMEFYREAFNITLNVFLHLSENIPIILFNNSTTLILFSLPISVCWSLLFLLDWFVVVVDRFVPI